MRRRVLLFIKTPPPYHGASIANMYVKNSELLRNKFDIKVIDSHYSQHINCIGKFKLSKIVIIIRNLFLLNFHIVYFKPDIVYFQLSHGKALLRDILFLILIKIYKVKIVYHLHGKGVEKFARKSLFWHKMYNFAFNNEFIICLSKRLTKDVKNYCKNPFIIPNCSPDFKSYLNESNQTINNISKSFNIIYLSNLIKSKGVVDLLRAGKRLREKGYNFVIHIIGSEADLTIDELVEIANNYQIKDFVVFHGPKYGKQKYQILLSGDVFILPTYYANEAFPISILEAMQARLAVISCDEGGIADVIENGINGYIVEKNNPIQIAEKIELLLNNPELREKMGQAGRKKYLENYTLDIFERRLVNVFKQVLANGR